MSQLAHARSHVTASNGRYHQEARPSRNVVAQARSGGKQSRRSALAASGSGRTSSRSPARCVIYLVRQDALRRGVPHPVGQHDPHAARRRLAVREQARLRPAHPVHEHRICPATRARSAATSSCSCRRIRPTKQRGDDPTPTLVKRLIGMPGDTLYMRDGVLYRERHRAAPGLRRRRTTRAIRTPIEPDCSTGSTSSSSRARASVARPRSRRTTTGARSSSRPITTS